MSKTFGSFRSKRNWYFFFSQISLKFNSSRPMWLYILRQDSSRSRKRPRNNVWTQQTQPSCWLHGLEQKLKVFGTLALGIILLFRQCACPAGWFSPLLCKHSSTPLPLELCVAPQVLISQLCCIPDSLGQVRQRGRKESKRKTKFKTNDHRPQIPRLVIFCYKSSEFVFSLTTQARPGIPLGLVWNCKAPNEP